MRNNIQQELTHRFEEISSRLEHDRYEVDTKGYRTDKEGDEGRSDLSWLDVQDTESVSHIYDILLKNQQWDESCPPTGRFVPRLVQVKTWIDPIDVYHHQEAGNMPEQVFCSGAFMNLEVFYLPMSFVEVNKVWNPNAGEYVDCCMIDYSQFGKLLPPKNEVYYQTFRQYNAEFGICLALRGDYEWLREFINRAIHWEYVGCDL